MLNNPHLAYQHIGSKFGLTKQRIGQLAKAFGIDGRQRQRERRLSRRVSVAKNHYSPIVRSIVSRIRRSGIQVSMYDSFQVSQTRSSRSKQLVIVNGVLCKIAVGRPYQKQRHWRQYTRFDVTATTKKAKFVLWAITKRRGMKLYVIPLTYLRDVSFVYIPDEQPVSSSKKMRKDWTQFEEAWHLLRDESTKIAAIRSNKYFGNGSAHITSQFAARKRTNLSRVSDDQPFSQSAALHHWSGITD